MREHSEFKSLKVNLEVNKRKLNPVLLIFTEKAELVAERTRALLKKGFQLLKWERARGTPAISDSHRPAATPSGERIMSADFNDTNRLAYLAD